MITQYTLLSVDACLGYAVSLGMAYTAVEIKTCFSNAAL